MLRQDRSHWNSTNSIAMLLKRRNTVKGWGGGIIIKSVMMCINIFLLKSRMLKVYRERERERGGKFVKPPPHEFALFEDV